MGGKALLLVTIGFAFILGYIALNISGMSTRAVGNMSWYAATTESHNLATTGANVGLAKFYSDTTWFGTIMQDFDSNGDSADGHFTGSFTVSMTDLGGGVARMRSVSTYHPDGENTFHDTIEVFFDTRKENSFTLYAWLTDFEGNDDFWVTGDTLWGRAHSNGNLHVNGKPVFMEKITATKGFNPKPGVGANKAVFKNGYETGVAEVKLPTDLSELINAANTGGRVYNGDIWVVLAGEAGNNNGVAYIRNSQLGPNIDTVYINGSGFNGVILGDSRVNVFGTLDGELTIGALDEIWVQDNVVYENRNTSTTDDMLGLVAEDKVVVANNTANQTNCEIDGSIFARTGTFEAENYNSGSPRGQLITMGSIVQKTRGKIAKYAGSTLKSGYLAKYRYDQRLADPANRPPYYPGWYVTTYSIANWWESVRVPEYAE
jgi:hypothetical protein